MTEVEQLARFVTRTEHSRLSDRAWSNSRSGYSIRSGVAIGALDAEPMVAIRELATSLGGNHPFR